GPFLGARFVAPQAPHGGAGIARDQIVSPGGAAATSGGTKDCSGEPRALTAENRASRCRASGGSAKISTAKASQETIIVARYKTAMADAEYRALAAFRHSIRKFLRFSEEAARAAGIEPQQYQLLLAVRGLPPEVEPTVGEL